MVRLADLLSKVIRIGPGGSDNVPLWAWMSLNTSERLRRSLVSSPETSRNWVVWVTGSNTMKNPRESVERHRRPFAGGKLHDVERDASDDVLDVVREVDARTPENLAHVFGSGSASGSCAAIWRTRGFTVKLTSTRLSSVGSTDDAQNEHRYSDRSKRLERVSRSEDPAAARTEHVPRQVEYTDSGGVQERADRRFFVQALRSSEGQRVDPVERAVRTGLDQPLQGCEDGRVGRLPQRVP